MTLKVDLKTGQILHPSMGDIADAAWYELVEEGWRFDALPLNQQAEMDRRIREAAKVPRGCSFQVQQNPAALTIRSVVSDSESDATEIAAWMLSFGRSAPYLPRGVTFVDLPHDHPAVKAVLEVENESIRIGQDKGRNVLLTATQDGEPNPRDWTYSLRIVEDMHLKYQMSRMKKKPRQMRQRTVHRVSYFPYELYPQFRGWSMIYAALPPALHLNAPKRLDRKTLRMLLSVTELDKELRRWIKELFEAFEQIAVLDALVHSQRYFGQQQCLMSDKVQEYYRRKQEQLIRKWMKETGRPRKEIRLNKRPEVRVGRKGESKYYV